jgi:hypothetical protein
MKNISLILAAFLATVAASASIAPASAGEAKAAVATHHMQMTDMSSARRHYRHHYSSQRSYAPGYAARGWTGSDPTAGPNSLLSFYRQNHICAIDEGYGRATRCN